MRVKLGEEIGRGDIGARPEDRHRARLVERGVIVRRDDAAHHDQDIRPPLLRS
jgi:hypothetical protein